MADADFYNTPDLGDYKMLINGKDGWIFRSRLDLKYRFRLSENTLDFFYRLGDAFRSQGTELVLAMTPTRGLTSSVYLPDISASHYNQSEALQNYKGMIEHLRSTGLNVAGIDAPQSMPGFFYPKDNHWTAEGAQAMAKSVAEQIKKLGIYEAIDKKEFNTVKKPAGKALLPNRFEQTARQLCGFPASESALPVTYETILKQETLDEAALFGEEEKPAVVLLGTSNSYYPEPSYANFEGFLKQNLGVDIINEAISGGSLQGSISNYLLSGRYLEDKPKIAIWELAAYYGYNQQDFFREIIPAVYGMCSAEDAVLSGEKILSGAKDDVLLLDVPADKKISGHQYYVALEFSEGNVRDIKLRFLYDEGRRDSITLQRSARNFSSVNGLYFAEMSDVMPGDTRQILLNARGVGGSVTYKICKAPDAFKPRPALSALKQKAAVVVKAQKHSGFMAWFFGNKNYIKIEKESFPSKTVKALPDMSGYTVVNILQKIPPSEEGKVAVAKMEKAVPLRKFAFDKRLVEMRAIQDRVDPLAIHIYQGHYNFMQLRKMFEKEGYIVQKDDAYILRLPIAVYPEASLTIRDLDRPLLLSQEKGAFLVSAGDLFIVNSDILGWSENNHAPAFAGKNSKSFRPFITTWDGSALYIAGSKLAHLGYGMSKSYGISISTNDVVQEEFIEQFGDLSYPTGWIINNEFNDMYFGFYSYEARDVVLYKNLYKDNIVYGIDPHDRSRNLIIADNIVKGSREKHGIILSRDVDNSFIFNNVIEHNKGSGFMLDRNCRGNIIANNIIRFNQGDGITIYESPDNEFINNIVEHNESAGLRVRNSHDVFVKGGRVALNKAQAFIVYEDDLAHTARDFVMDPVVTRSSVAFEAVDVESNQGVLKTSGFDRLSFRAMAWGAPSLRDRHYYGDLRDYEDELVDFQGKNTDYIVRERTNIAAR